MKNGFLLKALFGAFLILKLANVEPFNGWSWLFIFGVLLLHYLRYVGWQVYQKIGMRDLLDFKLAEIKYDILMREGVKWGRKQEKNNEKTKL